MVLFEIKRDSEIPIYQQIINNFIKLIEEGIESSDNPRRIAYQINDIQNNREKHSLN